MASLTIKDLSFTYAEAATPTLKTVNFSATPGQIILISGNNGSGKSTLLACISGVIPELTPGKLAGQIFFGDNADAELRKDSSTLGVLLQDSDVYLLEEVYEELAFALQNSGTSGPDLDMRIQEVASILGLSGLLQRKIRSLSGGERQKVAIGAALICDAPILLLDEPIEQLDPLSAYDLLNTLRALAESGHIILICMHNPITAAPWAHKILYLRNGELYEENTKSPEAKATPTQFIQPKVWTFPSLLNQTNAILEKANELISKNEHPAIEVRNLTHRFDTQSGIEDITLKVNQQEILALIGPNGSGKSTLVKHFVGLLRPQEGRVFVNGADIEKVPTWELAKQVGILFQNPDDQIFNATVADEIAWSLIARGIPKREALTEARKLAAEFDLENMLDKHPHDLNRSLRQLVALISVLITNPKILILDEPTKMMDFGLLTKVMAWLLIYREQGGTILIVTHDMSLAKKYTDRTAFIVGGRLKGIGTTTEILATDY
ncbi:MAG TPA: ATP-binding cassette domain-containing protein [Desulfosporosinus sp.]|nr:ATP-binding cassette domain-containing protein [Desulfosporosinus sp.]